MGSEIAGPISAASDTKLAANRQNVFILRSLLSDPAKLRVVCDRAPAKARAREERTPRKNLDRRSDEGTRHKIIRGLAGIPKRDLGADTRRRVSETERYWVIAANEWRKLAFLRSEDERGVGTTATDTTREADQPAR